MVRLVHAAITRKTYENLSDLRSSCHCLVTTKSRELQIPQIPVTLLFPKWGRANKHFWVRVGWQEVWSRWNQSKPFQTCSSMSKVCKVYLRINIFSLLLLVLSYLSQTYHYRAWEHVMYNSYYTGIWKLLGEPIGVTDLKQQN